MSKTPEPAMVGRTPWDAAVDVVRILGGLAPLVVIAAGVLFAFYKFQEQSNQFQRDLNETQQKIQDQFMADLQEARTALVTTYKDIGELSNQQITNIRTLLTLNDDVTQRLDEQRASLDTLRREVEQQQANAEAQVRAAEDARLAAVDAERLKREAEAARAELAAQVAAQKAELDRLVSDVKKKGAGLNDRAADIGTLAAGLQDLVGAVLRENDPDVSFDGTSERSVDIARRIYAEILVNPEQLLRDYAESPNVETLAALDRLAGVTEESLAALVAEGLGYALWYRVDDVEGGLEGFVGIAAQDDDAYRGVVFLVLGGERVVEILSAGEFVAMPMHSVDDWNVPIRLASLGEDGESVEIATISSDTTWSLEHDLLRDYFPDRLDRIYGEERPVGLLALDQFAKRLPSIYRDWLAGSEHWSPRLNIEMEWRAQSFDAARLPGLEQPMPATLRTAVVAVLDAAVDRDLGPAASHLSSSLQSQGNLGRLAAIALRNSFRIASVEGPAYAAVSQQPMRAQLPVPPAAQAVTEDALDATVVTEYVASDWGEISRLRLSFTRPNAGAPWQLSGWSEEQYIPPSSSSVTAATRG